MSKIEGVTVIFVILDFFKIFLSKFGHGTQLGAEGPQLGPQGPRGRRGPQPSKGAKRKGV